MTIKYRVVSWQFDSAKLAEILSDLPVEMLSFLEGYLDVSNGAIWHWKNNVYPVGVNYPNMSNFLKLCDALDLDPREFFILESGE